MESVPEGGHHRVEMQLASDNRTFKASELEITVNYPVHTRTENGGADRCLLQLFLLLVKG